MSENTNQSNQAGQTIPSTRRFRFPWQVWLIAPLAFLIGIGAGYLIWGKSAARANAALAEIQATAAAQQKQAAQAQQEAAQVQVPDEVKRYDVPEDDDPSIGSEDAPITLVEFSDFQCPYCQRWHTEVWKQIQEAYPGQVRLVYRDFPLPGHPEAVPAAIAANCANEQDKYWEYHDLLFSGSAGLGTEAYLQFAQDLKLDMEAFKQCIDEKRYEDEITADFTWASQTGVQSTPTFFMNGIPLVGAQGFDFFKQVIDLELAGQIP